MACFNLSNRWARWVARGSLLATVAALLATSCDSSSDSQASNGAARFANVTWDCYANSGSCWCYGSGPNSDRLVMIGTDTVSVLECGSTYPCCLLTLNQYGDYDCRCEDLANCQAEAASRQNTEVAASCPPVPRTTNCSKSGENCRAEYLSQMGYDGCCSGLACVTGSDGVPTCQ